MGNRKSFKPGDRVRVYATLNGKMVATKGTVFSRDVKDGKLMVQLEEMRKWDIFAHPKQCRRLVKKK